MNGKTITAVLTSALAALLVAAVSGAVVVYGRVSALEADNRNVSSRLSSIEGKLDELMRLVSGR